MKIFCLFVLFVTEGQESGVNVLLVVKIATYIFMIALCFCIGLVVH